MPTASLVENAAARRIAVSVRTGTDVRVVIADQCATCGRRFLDLEAVDACLRCLALLHLGCPHDCPPDANGDLRPERVPVC